MLMIINHSLIEEENTFTEHLASKIIYYKAGKLSLRLFSAPVPFNCLTVTFIYTHLNSSF